MAHKTHDFVKIGKRIKDERKKLGVPLDKMSEKIENEYGYKISRQAISDIEKGNSTKAFTVDLIDIFCEMFGCDAAYLLCEYDDCKTYDTQFIHNYTGLSANAINSLHGQISLSELFNDTDAKSPKADIIDLILEDDYCKDSLSSLLDMITGFCLFNISTQNNKLYTADKNGITKFQGRRSPFGNRILYNPQKAHFRLQDMESMYYLKIWDLIKDLKRKYVNGKVPDTN